MMTISPSNLLEPLFQTASRKRSAHRVVVIAIACSSIAISPFPASQQATLFAMQQMPPKVDIDDLARFPADYVGKTIYVRCGIETSDTYMKQLDAKNVGPNSWGLTLCAARGNGLNYVWIPTIRFPGIGGENKVSCLMDEKWARLLAKKFRAGQHHWACVYVRIEKATYQGPLGDIPYYSATVVDVRDFDGKPLDVQ